MDKFANGVRQFLKDEEGATLVEYGLLVGLLSIVAVGSIVLVGKFVNGAWKRLDDRKVVLNSSADRGLASLPTDGIGVKQIGQLFAVKPQANFVANRVGDKMEELVFIDIFARGQRIGFGSKNDTATSAVATSGKYRARFRECRGDIIAHDTKRVLTAVGVVVMEDARIG